MVKTIKALIASGLSALGVGVIHFISHKFIFNNPALMMSNITIVGIIVTIATFLIGFIGMKWGDWTK